MEENLAESVLDNLLQDRNLFGNSTKWANWMSQLAFNTCQQCVEQHGKIVDISELNNEYEVNAHFLCKCVYVPMRTIPAGHATNMGYDGADAQLFYYNKLPDYYISKKEAERAGWKNKNGNLNDVLPGKMIGGDIYKNKDFKLPDEDDRIWYEADINYEKGHRNRQRVVYSNDGLIFVTNDHYQTFYEITD